MLLQGKYKKRLRIISRPNAGVGGGLLIVTFPGEGEGSKVGGDFFHAGGSTFTTAPLQLSRKLSQLRFIVSKRLSFLFIF